ncbi:hypothetical protein WME99_44530 [Sorangium sp. So ce136]|uniref:hypothetical protein n=1 Tax=Sorangium sp. So ce136 TaxID=3133284 RepID=UPI003EFF16EC
MLYHLARGFSPPPLPMRLESLEWGGIDIAASAKKLVVDEGALSIECRIREQDGSLDPGQIEALSRRSLQGTCSDGSALVARAATCAALIRRLGDTGQTHELWFKIACEDWSILSPTKPAVLWAGVIDGDLPRSGGNMSFEAKPPSSSNHFCLKGQRTVYYLVDSSHDGERGWRLAVDARPSAIAHDTVRREMMCLAFCFGRPFTVSALYGLDEEGNVVGCLGSGFGAPHTGRYRIDPAVPEPTATRLHALPLFRALSARLADGGSPRATAELVAALSYAVEALVEPSARSLAVKRLLGAQAAARLVIGEDASLAGDLDRWNAWVSQQEQPIEEMARAGRKADLVAAVRRAALPRPSSLIDMAASSKGLSLDSTRALRDAVESTERELFEGRGGEHDQRQNDERPAYLRTVLVALVAAAVGYKGPISGWTRRGASAFYQPADASFWPVEGDGEPPQRFVVIAQKNSALELARGLWPPTFRSPSVPSSGDIGLIATFAGLLKERTEGRVEALVRPILPQRSEDLSEGEFDFVLRSAQLPTLETVLFSVKTSPNGGVVVRGWKEGEEESEFPDVADFLRQVGYAEKTKDRIQRLLFVASRQTA